MAAPAPATGVCALAICHREAPRAELLSELKRQVPDVLVVSDGRAPELDGALSAVAERAGVGLLLLEQHRGKGHALSAGIRFVLERPAPPTAVLVIDGDGQHPPDLAARFLDAPQSEELVIGDRLYDPAGMPLHRRVANRLSSWMLARATGAPVRDSQCGMRLLRGRALHDVPFPPGGYEAEMLHLRRCLDAGVRVAWVPVPSIYDGHPSSFRSIRDGVRVLAAIYR